MKLTPSQLEYIANQDWVEAIPFQRVTEPLTIDGQLTEYTKSYDIFETVRGDRLILRTEDKQ